MGTKTLSLQGGKPVLSEADHRRWPLLEQEEREAVLRVLNRGILSGADAPEARAFEDEFAAYVGADYALLTHSGTSALELGLGAVGVGEGDEVIVPAYSFVATALCVLRRGAVPRFVDVEPLTGLIDASLIEAAIRPNTKAIMPVHVHGCPADMDAIRRLAATHGLKVVEDAAQAHGARYGQPAEAAGTLGDAAGFSMQSSKNLSAGEGGVFVSNDAEAAETAHRIRSFGLDLELSGRDAYDATRPLDDGGRTLMSHQMGHMYRGNELMAAVARAQLHRLPRATQAAQAHAARLGKALSALPGVVPPVVPAGRVSVHHKFRVGFDLDKAGVAGVDARRFRDRLMAALRAEGANAVLWQDEPLPAHPLFSRLIGYGKGWPFRAGADLDDLKRNYESEAYPGTRRHLDTSIVLFSQSRPLIGQTAEVVERYGEAFHKVWAHRGQLAELALE